MEFFKEDKNCFDPVCSNSFLSRCGETSLQLSQEALLYGRGCSAGCEDNFIATRLRLLPFLAMLDGV